MKISPFIYGRAVTPTEFHNRRRTLRRLLGRLGTGQSTALIGQPHVGKTSLLNYLMDDQHRRALVGDGMDRCILSYLDSHMLGGHFTPSDFWAQGLAPLAAQCPTDETRARYELSKENQFGAFTLEQLFRQLGQDGWRLILLLDEFDALLNHPVLNSAEFYGSLRSLASRCPGLALVIAARRSLGLLNEQTQKINPHGSPYFNVFTELRLGPLAGKEANELLNQAGERFDKYDHQFVFKASGRHPYLLQAAAGILWEIHDQGKTGPARYQAASDELYNQTRAHFRDTWHAWSNAERKAVTAIALAQIPTLVKGQLFLWTELVEDVENFPELRGLKDAGTIAKDKKDNWRITQQAMLWWLADEIKRATRDDTTWQAWLREQELDGLLTRGEKKKIKQAAQKVSAAVGKGATTLIEAFAKGLGAGAAKRVLPGAGA